MSNKLTYTFIDRNGETVESDNEAAHEAAMSIDRIAILGEKVEFKDTASYTIREDFYENLYRQQARLKWLYLISGISIGMAIGLALSANAVTMTATVEQSDLNKCLDRCMVKYK